MRKTYHSTEGKRVKGLTVVPQDAYISLETEATKEIMNIIEAKERIRPVVFAVCNTMISDRLWKTMPLSDIGGGSEEARTELERQLGIDGISGSWTLDQLVTAVTEKH